ncbi:MAG TPA: UDP-N-acetylmuramoyl-tripeptide--D-alanyl-D-alanine ligase [Blastocatellia bacterium]|nr:UDP-N-acetylmuramoyl-tripeptide--D-alanyl-D-alanine ligase [Blastocatellia bacterium]
MKLAEILAVFGLEAFENAARTGESARVEPSGYSIDSRTLREGDLFLAIKGEIHDGHQYVADVLAKGAIAAVVQRTFDAGPKIDPARLIRVDDTLAALQRLASSVLKSWRGEEIAITGSMGKTTTKEMTAATLSRVGRVVKTAGNLNNEYGLPLSVMQMESGGAHASEFDFAVLEMGMNHSGEIERLAKIAPPDVAVVTVVAPVHLEFFSSIDEIAAAKSEIVLGTRSGGAVVLNADDERVAGMRRLRADVEYRTFGIERKADVSARSLESDGVSSTSFDLVTLRGEAACTLAAAGRHSVYNALAAAAVGDYYGILPEEIARALSAAPLPKMRGEVLRFVEGFTVIDDSYNSNPKALIEMIRTIGMSREASRRIVIAGEMLELGVAGPELHYQAGREIASSGVDLLIGVRGLAAEMIEGAREAGMAEGAARFCETPEAAAELIKREVRAGDLVLVKGSRGVRIERVVNRLRESFEQRRREG